tara:strand:- start:310 stop:570 length:261 start_codon:yes stop_codon:yes gene_type:complete
MSYRIESATKEEWAARCIVAEHRVAKLEAVLRYEYLWEGITPEDILEATQSDLERVVAYLKDMTERGDEEAKELLESLDITQETET